MKLFWLFLLLFCSNFIVAQKSNYYFRPEIMIGKFIPSYEIFTHKNPQFIIGASYEHQNNNSSINWHRFLHYPTTGVSFYATHFGAKEKGNAFSLIPFLEFQPFKNKHWSTKFGIGASYFGTKYNAVTNPTNEAVSTNITWAIQGFLHYNLLLKVQDLRLGLGIFHHSNGHTKLPNAGFNQLFLSVSTSFKKTKKIINSPNKENNKASFTNWKNSFFDMRYGTGVQVFVTENSALKNVYSLSVTGGIYYKEVVKFSAGINYRFYQHYYNYIKESSMAPFIDNPFKNASNIYFSLGSEILLGRISFDFQTGINLYKPFYATHYNLQRGAKAKKINFKKILVGRLGLKIYAINTMKKPKNNFYLSAHINSNFGQADFSELSVGFVHRFYK